MSNPCARSNARSRHKWSPASTNPPARVDAVIHVSVTIGRPIMSAHSTFLLRPSGFAVRKCVKSLVDVVTSPPSFLIAAVVASTSFAASADDTSTLTAVVVAVRSFFRAGDVRAPPPPPPPRLAGGGFPPRTLLVAAGTGAAPAPGSSSTTSNGFDFGDAAGDRDQTTFTSNDFRRFAVRGNVSAFFALSITALAALGDKHRTSVFASDTVGMDCRDAGGGDGDGDGDGDLAVPS